MHYSISVYGWKMSERNEENGDVEVFPYPLKVAKEVKEKHVNMLLINNGDTNHYCWVKSFSRLVGSGDHKKFFCRFCLHGFCSDYRDGHNLHQYHTKEEMEAKLKEHEQNCFVHKVIFIKVNFRNL